jgi:hypothetical protein
LLAYVFFALIVEIALRVHFSADGASRPRDGE